MNNIPKRPLQTALLFPISLSGKPDCLTLLTHLSRQGRLKKLDLIKLISLATEIMETCKNVVQVEQPCLIVGDLHGQFYDLARVIQVNGAPDQNQNYVFLGDYVNRGYFSVQILTLLLALKCHSPGNVHLLRGNHQTRAMTTHFNFRKQCLTKYDSQIYQLFLDLFKTMPIAAVLSGKFFLVHGGIPFNLQFVEELNQFDRHIQPRNEGTLCDLLWADPSENVNYFKQNDSRNCSYYYGYFAIKHFLERNRMLSIIRGHEFYPEGFQIFKTAKQEFPVVLTIFSASNYCQIFENKGAVVRLCKFNFDIRQHDSIVRPFVLPNFINGIQWSFYLIAALVNTLMNQLLKIIPKGGQINPHLKAKIKGVQEILRRVKQRKEEMQLMIKFRGTPPADLDLGKALRVLSEQTVFQPKTSDMTNESWV